MHTFFDKLGIKKPIFVGASDGGMVAQIYVQRYPGEAAGLILISTGGVWTKKPENAEKEILSCAAYAVVFETLQL